MLSLIFITVSLQLRLPPHLLESICFVETRHKQVITVEKNGDRSVGVCQVKLKTAKHLGFLGDEKTLLKPEVNVLYAGLYLDYQFKRYGNWARAVNAYNRGKSDSNKGSEYVNKVFNEFVKINSK